MPLAVTPPPVETPEPEVVAPPVEEAAPEEAAELAASDEPLVVLSCDREARTISFVVTNTHDVAWDFSDSLAFAAQDDARAVRVFLNNYEASRSRP